MKVVYIHLSVTGPKIANAHSLSNYTVDFSHPVALKQQKQTDSA